MRRFSFTLNLLNNNSYDLPVFVLGPFLPRPQPATALAVRQTVPQVTHVGTEAHVQKKAAPYITSPCGGAFVVVDAYSTEYDAVFLVHSIRTEQYPQARMDNPQHK